MADLKTYKVYLIYLKSEGMVKKAFTSYKVAVKWAEDNGILEYGIKTQSLYK